MRRLKIATLAGISLIMISLSVWSFGFNKGENTTESADPAFNMIYEYGRLVSTRIVTPHGFYRKIYGENSFESYLRKLPLQPHNTIPVMYNGRNVRRTGAYQAVLDLPIGEENLHQCADAIIRLKAEYHFYREEYDKIHFNFTNGFRVDYAQWMKGMRIAVKGNSAYWYHAASPSNTYSDLWNYLERVFMYAGTASLEKELVPVDAADINLGDILIQGGTPGHAMIIVDEVYNPETGEELYLLAQSNMPAQDIQVIKNPAEPAISPWYRIDEETVINSGRWNFTTNNIKRFKE